MTDATPRRPAAGLAAALLLAAGCGGGMGQVDGKVVWADGGPAAELEDAQVVFESAELKTSARGVVGPDGAFRLTTDKPGDGAPVGDYQVLLVESRKAVNPEGTQLSPVYLDPKYADFKTSGLRATVKPGTTAVTLTLDRVRKK